VTLERILQEANAHYAAQRLADAESVLAEGARRWPGDIRVQEALARLRWMRGEGAAFARDFEAAVAANPNAVFLRASCAAMLCRADLRDRAEPLLRDGLARDPGNVSYLISLGALLDEADRTEEGLALLNRAHALAPTAPSLAANRAQALLRLGRSEEALGIIEPERSAAPFDGEWIAYQTMAWRQLGDLRYAELCDYDAMVRAYDLAPPPGYANVAAFNQALAAALAPLHAAAAHPLGQSLRGGSQTTMSLLRSIDPVIASYLRALENPIRAYIAAMDDRGPSHPWSSRTADRFKLSGCWSVKLKPGGYHVNHLHPAGWISSAYYVALPESTGQEGWIKFGEPRWPAPGCTVEKVIQPQVGRLVLFPSYMWHGTIPFSTGERLTAPFDVVPA
jgi:Flp pilus assembly protein TadD